ncbi:MAG TPA: hypothetical protein VE604_14380 [Candidatus Polarisedimenticolia bacterium]|nr:hypothetical protein [Candidatus Polarisedimenticolia bacterium]
MKRKGLLFSSILITVVIVDMALFGSQIFAVLSELPHGFHLDVHGVRLHTPTFYTTSTGIAYGEYNFITMPSPTRHKTSMITIDFKRQPTSAKPFSDEMLQKTGLTFMRQRHASLAGRSGECYEYTNKFGMPEIECSFGIELRTSFIGSPSAIDDFYVFMNKVEELPRKN